MRKLMLENFTLFNKMHEGLIVLSEHDHRIQFASRPAVSLIKQNAERNFEARQLVESLYDNLEDSQQGIGLKFDDLQTKLFVPTKFTIEEFHSSSDLSNELNSDQQNSDLSLSLLDIVQAQLYPDPDQPRQSNDHNGRIFKVCRVVKKNKQQMQNETHGDSGPQSARADSSRAADSKKQFLQVRSKRIDYLESPAIAIYF